MHRKSRTTRNTDDFLSFRYEMFINFFWLLVFWYKKRKTQFLLCWLFLHRLSVNPPAELSAQSQNLNLLTQQTRGASHRPQLDSPRPESQLASRRDKSQLTAFLKKYQNSQPIASGHDVIHTSVPFPIWVFYCDICDCNILRARAWTPALIAEQPNRMIRYNHEKL